MTSFC